MLNNKDREPSYIDEYSIYTHCVEDILDWDFYLKDPPFKPFQVIELTFIYGGRAKPIPVIEPWDEDV